MTDACRITTLTWFRWTSHRNDAGVLPATRLDSVIIDVLRRPFDDLRSQLLEGRTVPRECPIYEDRRRQGVQLVTVAAAAGQPPGWQTVDGHPAPRQDVVDGVVGRPAGAPGSLPKRVDERRGGLHLADACSSC